METLEQTYFIIIPRPTNSVGEIGFSFQLSSNTLSISSKIRIYTD